MKCPYCCEEIKDEAIVCKYCSRDLLFFRPFEERLQSVERKLPELETTLSEVTTTLNNPKTNHNYTGAPFWKNLPLGMILWLIAIMVLLPFLCRFFINLLLPDFTFADNFILFSLVYLPLGVFIGVKWKGSHLWVYTITGLIAGFMQITVFIVHGELPSEYFTSFHFPAIMTITFSFISGSLLGDLIERRLYPDRRNEGFAKIFAEQLAGGKSSPSRIGASTVSYDERVKRIASLIAALAPILALVGTIISAVLAFLAKKP